MTQRILREAEAELAQAIGWYESVESGLDLRLKDEVRGTLAWIGQHPELPRLRSKGCRRVNLKLFPDYVAYLEWADSIWILAVAHGALRGFTPPPERRFLIPEV